MSITQVRVPMKAKGFGFPGATITGTCEPLEVGAGNQTSSLCKNSCARNCWGHLSSSQIPTLSLLLAIMSKKLQS